MTQILVVEDEMALVDVVSTVLTEGGNTVLQAYDGQTGLEMARRERPALVIADQMLPLMTGLDLCHALRAEHLDPPIPVLLMTAGNVPIEDTCPDVILRKPFTLDELERQVHTLLEAHAQPPRFFG
jgi:two-component system, sensor histidine kinase and response regulator